MKHLLSTSLTTRFCTLILAFLLSTCAVNPLKAHGTEEVLDSGYSKLRNTIVAAIPFPHDLENIEELSSVTIAFTITEGKLLDVLQIQGDNRELIGYVHEQLDGLSMQRFGAFAGKTIKIRVNFKQLR